MLKRDLGTSVADLLTVIRSYERTVTHQHELFKKVLDQERINKPTSMLKSPLVGDVLTKASQHALRKVFNIYNRYLPPGLGKEEIPLLCSGNTKRTMGIPCIHIIKECVDMQRPLSLDQFHEQWYLYRHEDLPPVNPRMIVLGPRVVESGRGRPAGATNIPTSQPAGIDKIRPLVENHRRLKECCRKKNHGDEDAGAGAGVYNLVDQMASRRLRKRDVKGIVGTMNLMVTLEVDDEVLAVAVLSELTNAASMMVYRVT